MRVYGGVPVPVRRAPRAVRGLGRPARRSTWRPVRGSPPRRSRRPASPTRSLRLYMTPGREGSGRAGSRSRSSGAAARSGGARGRAGSRWSRCRPGRGAVAARRRQVDELRGEHGRRGRGEAPRRRRRGLPPRDGIVLEGPTTNVWWRRGETLYTPSLDLGILEGVTRAALIELAAGLGYEVEEGAYPLAEVAEPTRPSRRRRCAR